MKFNHILDRLALLVKINAFVVKRENEKTMSKMLQS